MRILLLLVTVLRVVVSVLSTRADIAKSEGKTMTQSFGTYNAWGSEEDSSQNYSSRCTSRWTWAREARSSRPRRMIAVAGGAWRLGLRVGRFSTVHVAQVIEHGSARGHIGVCMGTIRPACVVLTSGAWRCNGMCVRAFTFGLRMWSLQGQAIGARICNEKAMRACTSMQHSSFPSH